MNQYWAALLLLVVITFPETHGKVCPSGVTTEEVDWIRVQQIGGMWYDMFDIPRPVTLLGVDCWDMTFHNQSHDGVWLSFQRTSFKGKTVPITPEHFFLNFDGSYTFLHNDLYKMRFALATASANDHATDSMPYQTIESITDTLSDMKFFFGTDYETFFIIGACNDQGELGAFVKSRTVYPDPEAIVNAANWMSENGFTPHYHLKKECISRGLFKGQMLNQ